MNQNWDWDIVLIVVISIAAAYVLAAGADRMFDRGAKILERWRKR
jgi:hypothetical protein